jgi:hypothetical protein
LIRFFPLRLFRIHPRLHTPERKEEGERGEEKTPHIDIESILLHFIDLSVGSDPILLLLLLFRLHPRLRTPERKERGEEKNHLILILNQYLFTLLICWWVVIQFFCHSVFSVFILASARQSRHSRAALIIVMYVSSFGLFTSSFEF